MFLYLILHLILHCFTTFIRWLSFSQWQATNTTHKSQHSKAASAPGRGRPSPHRQFSCVSGSHWGNWKKRGSACSCLTLPSCHWGASVPALWDPALKTEMGLIRIQVLDSFLMVSVVKVGHTSIGKGWRGRLVGWARGLLPELSLIFCLPSLPLFPLLLESPMI